MWRSSLSCLVLVLALLAPGVPRGNASPQADRQGTVVQVGAFRDLERAEALVGELAAQNYQAQSVQGGGYYRVVLGPFSSNDLAEAALTKLKLDGYDGYIRHDLRVPQRVTQQRSTQAAPSPQEPAASEAQTTVLPTEPQFDAPRRVTDLTQSPGEPETAAVPGPRAEGPPAVTATTPAPPEEALPSTGQRTATGIAVEKAPQPRPTNPTPAPVEPPEGAEPPTAPDPPVTLTGPAAPPDEVPEIRGPTGVTVAQADPHPRQPGVLAQQSEEPASETGSKLRLLVIQGDGAINNIRQRTARDPIVQAVDENDRPIAGVAITFSLPSRGASGVFANGARSVTVFTDAQGMATATGLSPNSVAGEVSIQVSASHQGQTASALISQTNAAAAGGMSAATIGIIGAVAAGAAVGVVLAVSGGDSSPTMPTPTPSLSGTATVRPGGVTIDVP